MGVYDEIEEIRAWGRKEGEKGSRYMESRDMRYVLDAFFNRFRLTPQAQRIEHEVDKHTGEEYWVFVGFEPYWDEPGLPVIPQSELGVMNTLRLRKTVQRVFSNASKKDELYRLTTLRGESLDGLLRAIGV